MQQGWSVEKMPDLTGRIVIVTGANSGIGYEAAKAFASRGAQTILACRNLDSAHAAAVKIRSDIQRAEVEVMQLDLARQASVRSFADEFKTKHGHLDVLVNNAGIMWTEYGKTEDGFESQFGTNHLGHFALTGLLVDSLSNVSGSRVVNVSSIGHRSGTMDFANLMYEDGQGYTGLAAYGRSKLANLLFTYELQRRFDAANQASLAVAAHPGATSTNLGRHLEERWYFRLLLPFMNALGQDAAMGALPTIRAAVDRDVAGGDYFGPARFMEARGFPIKVESSALSHDTDAARRLWEVSERLTGVRFFSM